MPWIVYTPSFLLFPVLLISFRSLYWLFERSNCNSFHCHLHIRQLPLLSGKIYKIVHFLFSYIFLYIPWNGNIYKITGFSSLVLAFWSAYGNPYLSENPERFYSSPLIYSTLYIYYRFGQIIIMIFFTYVKI